MIHSLLKNAAIILAMTFLLSPPARADDSAPPSAAPAPAPRVRPPSPPAPSSAVSGPLAAVPAGQILVLHIPEAARVLAQQDAAMKILRIDPAESPLRKFLASLKLNQDLSPDSALTLCVAPPIRLGGPLLRWTLVTRIDPARLAAGAKPDAGGVCRRDAALAALVLPAGTVALGDADVLADVARAPRGVQVSRAEEEVLRDADLALRIDLRQLLARHEPQYQALRAALAARIAEARRDDVPQAQRAMLELQLAALDRLWTRTREFTTLTAGLSANERSADVRLHLGLADDAKLGELLADHPPLAGDLNPPLPSQSFVALGHASFDGPRLALLLQWAIDAATDATLAFGGDEVDLDASTAEALGRIGADLADVLGSRAGFVVPLTGAREPVLQLDAVVELKEDSRGAAWRARAPTVLDGLVYLAQSALRPGHEAG